MSDEEPAWLRQYAEDLVEFRRRIPMLALMWLSGFRVASLTKFEIRKYSEIKVTKLKLSREILEHFEDERDPRFYKLMERGLMDDVRRGAPSMFSLGQRHDLSDLLP